MRLTPQNWLNQRKSRNTATNKHTNASEEPQAVLVLRSFPVPKRVPTWVFAETPQRTNMSVPCRVTKVVKDREERKVVDEREISMDYVAIPASYEHPGFQPTPWVLQVGWLSTIPPRRSTKRGCREACRRRRRLHARRRASNLRSPGRGTRALPVCYADDMQCNRHQTHHYTPPRTHGRLKCAHHRRHH